MILHDLGTEPRCSAAPRRRRARLAAELEAFCRLIGLEEAARVAQPSRKYPGRTLVEIKQRGKAPSKKSKKSKKKKSTARESGGDEPS